MVALTTKEDECPGSGDSVQGRLTEGLTEHLPVSRQVFVKWRYVWCVVLGFLFPVCPGLCGQEPWMGTSGPPAPSQTKLMLKSCSADEV